MSMIKVIPPRAWAELDGEPQLAQIKVASTGLRGNDFSAFVKQASHPLAMWVREHVPPAGEIYVHSRALGAHEFVGQNRNSDLYGLTMLRRDLPTFEKNAYWFLNHQNSNPKKSYGKVKKSSLNEQTGMVDTITSLNATKEAAERNGNLVAERTLQKMASGQDVAVSQSCKVPFDRCMACGHEAKNRSHYCTAATGCKYGGCRDNLGRVFDDGFHLGVDNPVCNFFDLSDVSDTRGADRTAFITGKVANDGRIVGGAELAESLGLIPPDFILDPAVRSSEDALRKIAAQSVNYPYASASWDDILVSRGADTPDLTGSDAQVHTKIALLSAQGVVLPPDIWLSAVTGSPVDKCASVFAGGFDIKRDLLDRDDRADILGDYTIPRVELGTKIASHALTPTAVKHVKESRLVAVKQAAVKPPHSYVPNEVKAEAKARYLAYQAGIVAAHEKSANSLLILCECIRHHQTYNA